MQPVYNPNEAMGRDRLAARGFLLYTLLVAVAFGVAAAATPGTLVPVVQVAVNYSPGKSTMISGLLVDGGRFVLTQASILHGAYATAVAFTNTDVLDPVLERLDGRLNIAVLRLPRPVRAEFAAVAELPSGELRATIVGAPTAFETSKLSVFLKPVAGGRRWEIVPAIPLAFRGAPILDSAGRLLGIAVEEPEGTSVVGIPVMELRDLVPGLAVRRSSATPAAPVAPPARASQSAVVPPVSTSNAVAPAPEPKAEGEPAPPPARASQSAAVPPVSTSNAVAPAPEPKAEGESELPKTALEPIERPLAGVSASVPAAKVEVQPPPEPAPAVAGRPLAEKVEAEEGEARKATAGSETATTGRSSAEQASSPLPTTPPRVAGKPASARILMTSSCASATRMRSWVREIIGRRWRFWRKHSNGFPWCRVCTGTWLTPTGTSPYTSQTAAAGAPWKRRHTAKVWPRLKLSWRWLRTIPALRKLATA